MLSRPASQAWTVLCGSSANCFMAVCIKLRSAPRKKNTNIKSLCEVESASRVFNKLKARCDDEVISPAGVSYEHQIFRKRWNIVHSDMSLSSSHSYHVEKGWNCQRLISFKDIILRMIDKE